MREATFEFMRKVPVNLLRYLPQFLSKDDTLKNVEDTLSWKHERYRLKLIDTARQFFLETATWGLPDWEKFLGITPKEGATFDARKAACRVKLRGLATMTPKNTVRLMEEFMTSGHAEVEELGDGEIRLILDNGVFYWDELFKALWEFLPAHLTWSLKYHHHYENEIFIGIDEVHADKALIEYADIAESRNDLYVAEKIIAGDKITVDYDANFKAPDNNLYAGLYLGFGGYVEIDAEIDDDKFDGEMERWLWLRWKEWNRNPLVKIYGHHFDIDEGEIDPDNPDEPEVFPDGNFLRLYYKFPSTRRLRYTTLPEPKKNLTGTDINRVGNFAAANKLILNWRGDATTGISRALYITKTVEKIF